MNTMSTVGLHRFVVCVGLIALSISSALAQATRTWVSGVGDDANPCSRTAPCKTFAGAISKTAASGEIDALDPGGFGGVTITKEMTIDGSNTMSGVLVAGTNAIVINAGVNDTVKLRGLSINGSAGLIGIKFLTGKALIIEDCQISGFNTRGISIETSNNSQVFITAHACFRKLRRHYHRTVGHRDRARLDSRYKDRE